VLEKIKRSAAVVLAAVLTLPLLFSVIPERAAAAEEAKKLEVSYVYEGFTNQKNIGDTSYKTYATGAKGSTVGIMAKENIGFIYISFNHAPGKWTLSSSSKKTECGADGFIHEYVDVSGTIRDTNTVSLTFPAGVEIDAISVYGKGEIPADVQVWQPVCETADILLLSAHTDDDQLYFAGLIPYYVTVKGLKVQVVYFTEHFSENERWHERLDALWTAGERNYPVISEFPDKYSSSAAGAYTNFKSAGFSEDTVVGWVAEQLRRFRPLVAVTHDFKGEYGHGQHMAAADALTRAVVLAADSSKNYGGYPAYDVPKTYIHLYDKEKIVLDVIDQTFEELGGVSPFAVSQKAFLKNTSQLKWTDLTRWMFGINYPQTYPDAIKITKASQITETPPQNFGLYRRAEGVPADVLKNDFMENLTPYGTPVETEPETEPLTEPVTEQVTEPVTTQAADAETSDPAVTTVTEPETTASAENTTAHSPAETTEQHNTREEAARNKILGIFGVIIILVITAVAVVAFLSKRNIIG